jgi:hypothetical protein
VTASQRKRQHRRCQEGPSDCCEESKLRWLSVGVPISSLFFLLAAISSNVVLLLHGHHIQLLLSLKALKPCLALLHALHPLRPHVVSGQLLRRWLRHHEHLVDLDRVCYNRSTRDGKLIGMAHNAKTERTQTVRKPTSAIEVISRGLWQSSSNHG